MTPNFFNNYFKRLIMIFPIIIAIVITGYLVRHRNQPDQVEHFSHAPSVRIIKTQAVSIQPRVIGNGYVQPEKNWQAVAQVSGKIVEKNAMLKKGAFFKKDTILLKIDPTAYKLAIAQMESVIEQIKAQIATLDVEKKNILASLAIEEKALALSKKELNRQTALFTKNRISASRFDQERLKHSQQMAKVQTLKNSLNVLPSNKKALHAQLAMNQSKLADARLNLSYTIIKAPFHCRITEVHSEIAQFAQKGQMLIKADSTNAVEIPVFISVSKMRRLLSSVDKEMNLMQEDMIDWKEKLGFHAVVRFKLGQIVSQWQAEVSRIDASMDPQTRTIGIIVVVDNPYAKIRIGERPPLIRNMFCEVEISGKPLHNCILIPRMAIHDNMIYSVIPDQTLKKLPIKPDFYQGDFSIIRQGLMPDIKIVISDLSPAVDGMSVNPIIDQQMTARILAESSEGHPEANK
jgi:multidrug efflux pump subunit AcrA (membrane-fusion protein)